MASWSGEPRGQNPPVVFILGCLAVAVAGYLVTVLAWREWWLW